MARIPRCCPLLAAALLGLATLPAGTTPARAAPPERLLFLVCQPGGPELEASEQTVIRDFYRYVGTRLGMKEDAIDGAYYNRKKDCVKALAGEPGVLMLSLDLYLDQRAALDLEPVAQVDLASGTASTFYLMGRADGPSDLTELRGKPVTGTHLEDPRFVARVVMDGKLGAPGELVLRPETLGLRAVRSVLRGKAAAVLLDSAQHAALADTPFAKDLKVLYTSPALPNPPVAVSLKRVPAGLGKRLGKVMMEMVTDPAGQKLIKTFGLKGFVLPAPKTWDALEAKLRAER
jgi:hypothetical protein